jgi:hypothetical protein
VNQNLYDGEKTGRTGMTDNATETISGTNPGRSRRIIQIVCAVGMGILCLMASIIWPILAAAGVGCLIFAAIQYSNPRPSGNRRLDPRLKHVLIVLIVLALVLPGLVKVRKTIHRTVCRLNMFYGVYTAFLYYQDEYNVYPAPDQWCDLLCIYGDVAPKGFYCPASDAVEGECTYALNKYLYESQPSEQPQDMVFLFETDSGKDSGPRAESVQQRAFYQHFSKEQDNRYEYLKDRKVYPRWWNLVGGPEMATTDYHGTCQVYLRNGSVLEVKKEDLPGLRWKPVEPNIPVLE